MTVAIPSAVVRPFMIRMARAERLARFSHWLSMEAPGARAAFLLNLYEWSFTDPPKLYRAPFPPWVWETYFRAIQGGRSWSDAMALMRVADLRDPSHFDRPKELTAGSMVRVGYWEAGTGYTWGLNTQDLGGDLAQTIAVQRSLEAWGRAALQRDAVLDFQWTNLAGAKRKFRASGETRYAFARNLVGLSEAESKLFGTFGLASRLLGIGAVSHLFAPQIRPSGLASSRHVADLFRVRKAPATAVRVGTPDVAGDIAAAHRLLGAAAFGAGAGLAGYKLAPPQYRLIAAAVGGIVGFVGTEIMLTPKQA